MKTLSATARAQKALAAAQIVWLVQIDADAPSASETVYLGSRTYNLGGHTYLDVIAPGGLRIGRGRLRVGGGLTEVVRWSLELANTVSIQALRETYFWDNDAGRVYLVFVTGSEVVGDLVPMAAGAVEDAPFDAETWRLEVVDATDQGWRDIPQQVISPGTFPMAPFSSYGRPLPVAFGDGWEGPYFDNSLSPVLARARQIDQFALQFEKGPESTPISAIYQYYAGSKLYAVCTGSSYPGVGFTIDAGRQVYIAPVLPVTGINTCADWEDCISSDGLSVEVGTGGVLAVWIGGCDVLGTATAGYIRIITTGTYDYDILYNGVSIASDTGLTAESIVTVPDFVTRHADSWDFRLYEVVVTGVSANAAVGRIYLNVSFSDKLAQERQPLEVFCDLSGWRDYASYYQDGAVVYSSGAVLTGAARILAAVLRGKRLMAQPTAKVSTADITDAHSYRSAWVPTFCLDEQVTIDWLTTYGFEMGMHIYRSVAGVWRLVAQDRTRTPAHTFGEWNIAVRNPEADPSAWIPDVKVGRTAMRDLINEAALSYRLDRGSGEYMSAEVRSGAYRLTGTCAIVPGSPATTGTLTDGTKDFATAKATVGDVVYVYGDTDYQVTAVGTTTLTLTAISGTVAAHAAGTTYYEGPNLSGAMLRSQLRYKTSNALGGGKKPTFMDVGGYRSDLIVDETTAGLFMDHLVEWRSQRRLSVEIATFLNAVDVELGDFAWLDHPLLPEDKRPALVGVLGSDLTIGAGFTVQAFAGLVRAGDYLLIGSEVVQVPSVTYATNTIVFTRHVHNTTATSHAAGAAVYILNATRWEVSEVETDVGKAQVRLTLEEVPRSYLPLGRIAATGYPAYGSATPAERKGSGWAAYLSGRVDDENEYSTLSYVGVDTGTYTE